MVSVPPSVLKGVTQYIARGGLMRTKGPYCSGLCELRDINDVVSSYLSSVPLLPSSLTLRLSAAFCLCLKGMSPPFSLVAFHARPVA